MLNIFLADRIEGLVIGRLQCPELEIFLSQLVNNTLQNPLHQVPLAIKMHCRKLKVIFLQVFKIWQAIGCIFLQHVAQQKETNFAR